MATQHHYRYRIYNVCVCRQVCECRNVNFLLIIIIPFLSPVRVGGALVTAKSLLIHENVSNTHQKYMYL